MKAFIIPIATGLFLLTISTIHADLAPIDSGKKFDLTDLKSCLTDELMITCKGSVHDSSECDAYIKNEQYRLLDIQGTSFWTARYCKKAEYLTFSEKVTLITTNIIYNYWYAVGIVGVAGGLLAIRKHRRISRK